MPRIPRIDIGGLIYHVLNRAVAQRVMFEDDGDYLALMRVLAEAQARHPMRILSYCVMPNHWHFVLQPCEDGGLSAFMAWFTMTHTQRWHTHHETAGTGHLYQGRFKSFPVQDDGHFLSLCRYVERNPLRANLVRRAEDWRWSSLWQQEQLRKRQGCLSAKVPDVLPTLSAWPVPCAANWLEWVNSPQNERELNQLRFCAARGLPWGDPAWIKQLRERSP